LFNFGVQVKTGAEILVTNMKIRYLWHFKGFEWVKYGKNMSLNRLIISIMQFGACLRKPIKNTRNDL